MSNSTKVLPDTWTVTPLYSHATPLAVQGEQTGRWPSHRVFLILQSLHDSATLRRLAGGEEARHPEDILRSVSGGRSDSFEVGSRGLAAAKSL